MMIKYNNDTETGEMLRLLRVITVNPKMTQRELSTSLGLSLGKINVLIKAMIEKGFIKAKIVSYDDFIVLNGWKGAAEAGKVRLEGKDYVMQEGDVVEFMFNL